MSYFQVLTTAVLLCMRTGVLSTPLCPTGDFDSQLRHLLHKQILSTQEAAHLISQVLGDMQRTLNQRWQGYELSPYGSSATGLYTKTSDLDFSLQLRNFNSSASSRVLQEAKTLFMERPALYSDVRVVDTPKYILVSFFHIPSQRQVDLIFSGDGAVYNSKLVKYYFHLDERFQPLGAFLKLWFQIQGLTGHGQGTRTLPNYGLYLLIIFYLQQKKMAPPAYVLKEKMLSHIFNNWDVGFNELPYGSENTESLHQLLGGFFKFYSEFDFEHYIVSPFAGRPIPKNAFTDIDNFPEEYTLINNTSTHIKLEIRNNLNINTDVCIQDVFVHNSNVAKRFSHELATKFKYLMKSVATMFEELPSDCVLRAILVVEAHEGTVISHNNCTVNWINKYDCIARGEPGPDLDYLRSNLKLHAQRLGLA